MKFFRVFLVVFSCLIFNNSYSQLTVNTNYTAVQLMNALVGSGVSATLVSSSLADSCCGYFNGVNSNIGLKEGVILTSGNVRFAKGPNSLTWAGEDNTFSGDPDLNAIINPGVTLDASILEFDMVVQTNTIEFKFVFASEEYPWVPSAPYNDVFAFFISGPGIIGKKNIALVPNKTTPISIDSVNDINNSSYYIDNASGSTVEYDGFTKVLVAKATVIAGQTYRLKLAVADAQDGIYDSAVLLLEGSLNSTFAGPDISLCSKDSVRFQADTIAGFTYSWSPTTGLDNPNSINPKISLTNPGASPYKVKYSVIGTSGTVTIIDTVEVTVNPLPMTVATAVSDSICPQASTTLNASGANNYEWRIVGSPGAISTSPSLSVVIPSTTSYELTGSNLFTCQRRDTITIFSRELPPVLISSAKTQVCLGTGVLLTASGALNYSWSTTSSSTGLSTSSGYMASPLFNTTYILTGTNKFGCTNKDSLLVEVLPLPIITINTSEDSICPGGYARLAGRGGVTYTWQNKLNPGPFISSDSVVFASPTITSTYIVIGTDTNGCENTNEQVIVVNPKPSGTAITGPPYACPGSFGIIYLAQPSSPLITYEWTLSSGHIKAYENRDTLRVNYGNPGVAMITLQEKNEYECLGDIISYNVEVKEVFTPPAAIGEDSICTATSISGYNAPFNNPGSTYLWHVEGGSIVSGNGTASAVINWTSIGIHVGKLWYEEVTSGTPPCTWISDTLSVSVFLTPGTGPVLGDSSLCSGTSALYSVNSQASSAYVWSLSSGGVISLGQGSRFIQVNWNTVGVHTVSVIETSPQGCVGAQKAMTVTVNPLPVIAQSDFKGPLLVCFSSSNSIYSVQNAKASSRYYWDVQGGDIIRGQGSDSITVSWKENDLHNISVYEKSKDSCVSEPVTRSVAMDGAVPEITSVSYPMNHNSEMEISWNLSYKLGELNTYNLYKRRFRDNSAWELIAHHHSLNRFTDRAIRPQEVAYEYRYTIQDACGDSSSSLAHNSILLKGSKQGNSVHLSWNPYRNWQGGVQRYELWRKLDGEINFSLYRDNGKDTLFSSENALDGFLHCYRVKAIETGSEHFSWSNDTCINFSNLINIPSAFSPNGDGVNDTWVIRNIEAYKNSRVEIFNRWGELVFQSSSYHNQWNGMMNGKSLPDGAYYYVIKLQINTKDQKESFSGTVTIVK